MSTQTTADLLAAYDAQLRGEPEVPSALRWHREGGIVLAVYHGGRGFIAHDPAALSGLTRQDVDDLVARTTAAFLDDPEIVEVEWKTRTHDPGHDLLARALVARGFVAGEPESVMVGHAADLAVNLPLPAGVALRRITSEADVRAMTAMQDEVFGNPGHAAMATALAARAASEDDPVELWIAEADGEIVCTGRLEPVPGTDFAGIWGGATRPAWRGQGIYRALTAARARSGLTLGHPLIQSDSTEYSRPILERSGFVRVTTTTPYEWRRA